MDDSDSTWLTFRELAAAVGISPRAAEARARRNIRAGRWAHRTDNDARRTGRVLVPAADIAAMRQGTHGVAGGVMRHDTRPRTEGGREGSPDPVVAPLRAALQAEQDRVAALTQELAATREGLARQEGETAGLKEALRRGDLFVVEVRDQIEQERGRADSERDRADQAERERQTAERERDTERAARLAAEAGRDTALAAARAGERRWENAEAALAGRTSGGPLARWRTFWRR